MRSQLPFCRFGAIRCDAAFGATVNLDIEDPARPDSQFGADMPFTHLMVLNVSDIVWLEEQLRTLSDDDGRFTPASRSVGAFDVQLTSGSLTVTNRESSAAIAVTVDPAVSADLLKDVNAARLRMVFAESRQCGTPCSSLPR
jgi:hypothetical protein